MPVNSASGAVASLWESSVVGQGRVGLGTISKFAPCTATKLKPATAAFLGLVLLLLDRFALRGCCHGGGSARFRPPVVCCRQQSRLSFPHLRELCCISNLPHGCKWSKDQG